MKKHMKEEVPKLLTEEGAIVLVKRVERLARLLQQVWSE